MKSITKYLPISLIKSLNSFNRLLADYRDVLEIDSTESKVTLNGAHTKEITIRYSLKESTSFFTIVFNPVVDYLSYNYYPNDIASSKTKKTARHAYDQKMLEELERNMEVWKNNLVELVNLKDPLDFFKDTFIESYSAEIIDFVGGNSEMDYFPLSMAKQLKVIELIKEQQTFVEKQLNEIEDTSSEKFQDLNTSLIELEYIKENLPRMTNKDLKERWSSTFAVLIKWCGKQLAAWAKVDAENDGNISRSIGSLIGGIFGVPKIE
ncbi:hypothetical protein K5V07_04910 [Flavobacterium sp. CHNK8]|uniref:hypothetical protein n=1 Tax=Flavobacterium sp. CHNK8 TaxID=2871165 RepID=UPI001C8EC123|nr:hypothetical protein [Flavobacterium sp. CHNK8]QZK89860.1 hypothetical protein K5V07_04910 [Flavobacterium sp. CHNK8]